MSTKHVPQTSALKVVETPETVKFYRISRESFMHTINFPVGRNMFKELVHGERIVKAKILFDSKSKKKSIKMSIQILAEIWMRRVQPVQPRRDTRS